jgi:hypothetical protein
MERARQAAEAAKRAAEAAAQRAAQQASKAPRSSTSTFETRPRPPVALDARPPDVLPAGESVPRHLLARWAGPGPTPESTGPGAATATLAGLKSMGPDTLLALASPGPEPRPSGDATAETAPAVQPPVPQADDGTTEEASATSQETEVTAGPMTGEMTEADAEEINQLAEENPAEAARRMEELVATDPKYQDPAMVDALLARCAPALARINEVLGMRAEEGDYDDSATTPYTRDTLEALAFVTSRATPAMQQQVGAGLAAALPDGDLNQFDDILGELAAAGGPGAALYNAVFGALSATKPAAAQQLEAERVEAATVAFNEAQAGVEGLNNELAALIGAAGPGLTQAEYDKLVADFKAAHAEEYARFEAAGADLTALIAGNQDVLAHPENHDPALVDSVRAAMNELPELAQTQAGFQYLNSEMLKSGRGEPSLFDQLGENATWIKSPSAFYEKLSTALVEAAGLAMLNGRPGDAEAALNFLEAKPHIFGLDAQEAGQLRDDLEIIYKGAQRGHSPDQMRTHFQVLRNHIDEFGLSSRGSDALKVLGVLAGLAGTNFDPQSTSEAIRTSMDVLGAGADAVGLGAGVLGAAGRIGGALGNVALGAGFVTGVLDGMQAYAQARQGEWDHALSSGLLAAGGVAPVALAIMGFPGVGTLVGGLLLAGGAGVGWWAGQNDQEQFQEQRLDALLAAGVPEHIAKVLVDADPFRMQLLQSAGFTPDQIRVMAERYPGMLTGDAAAPINGVYAGVMSGAFTPDEMMAMLDAASQGGTDPFGADILLTALAAAPQEAGRFDGGPKTRAEWVELLRWASQNSPDGYVNSDAGRAAIERALAALG